LNDPVRNVTVLLPEPGTYWCYVEALMDWFQPIDLYCERVGELFWAEPLNAVSNAAFLLAALAGLRRYRALQSRDWPALAMIVLVALIGVGSFLFHTFANRWSLLADTIPIQIFMLFMFGLMLVRLLATPVWLAVVGSAAFLVAGLFAPRLVALISSHERAGALAGYGTGLLAMLVLGGLAQLSPQPPRRDAGALVLVAGCVFAVSLMFRTLDHPLCDLLPTGTHGLWHTLNGLTLWLLLTAALALGHARAIGAIRS
jgi:hypothetical protein